MLASIASAREHLGHRFGEAVFLQAQRDLASETLDRKRHIAISANVLSLLVLTTPFLAAAAGVALLVAGFPSLLPMIFGGVLLAFAYALVPKRAKLDPDLLTRDGMPASFAVLDRLSEALNTEGLSRIAVLKDFNAFMLHSRGERILGIGATLWLALNRGEQLAVLAHEVAHQANGDPARSGLTAKALFTLETWLWYIEPDDSDDLIGSLVMFAPFLAVSALYRLLLRMTFLESQRAEYLADAMAARVAGPEAVISLMNKLALADEIEKQANTMHGTSAPGGIQMIERLAGAITSIPDEDRQRRLDEARQKKLSVDETHPPSVYRIAFLRLLAERETPDPLTMDPLLDAMGRELAPYFARLGDDIQTEMKIAAGM